ncbi:hypothetical protein E2562_030031 [Oryza meyeriana var. granulata]|uniref:Uncharacterized protein n=1 Tax=Oryza meyeriana var. granulata TaxID=110450 RepID=A0A6G1EBU7_9ORYZ|nr:hypothetical protein E2562_030031 [Oryza meyeriana var. granulata]
MPANPVTNPHSPRTCHRGCQIRSLLALAPPRLRRRCSDARFLGQNQPVSTPRLLPLEKRVGAAACFLACPAGSTGGEAVVARSGVPGVLTG